MTNKINLKRFSRLSLWATFVVFVTAGLAVAFDISTVVAQPAGRIVVW